MKRHTIKKPVRQSRQRKARLGAAVVEFAIVSPLMILLTMGMIEIGRVVMVKQILVNASREGARLAILPGSTTASVTAHVEQELTNQTIHGASVSTVPADLTGASTGTPVTVKIRIAASAVSWIPNPAFTLNTILEAETTMRRESNY